MLKKKQEQVCLMHLKMPPMNNEGLHLAPDLPGSSFNQGDPFHVNLNYNNSGQEDNLDLYV